MDVIDVYMTETMSEPPDFTLIVEGEKIPVHKVKLAEYSRYFEAMFNIDMKESSDCQAHIKEIGVDVLKSLVDYAYDGKLDLDVDAAISLLGGACMLQFDGAIKLCNNYLYEHVDPSTCLSIMHLADANGLNDLYNKAKTHSLWCFSDVIKSEDFQRLPKKLLINYISNCSINIASEYKVFEAIKNWISFSVTDRESEFPSLFECLRLNSLTECNMKQILDSGIIKKHTACVNALEEMLAPSIPETSDSSDDDGLQRKRRKSEKDITLSRQVPIAMWSVGGDLMNDTEKWSNQAVSEFDINTGLFQETSRLPMFQEGIAWGYKACCLGKDLYIVGGEVKQGTRPRWSMDIWKYDVLDHCWSVIGQMDHPRRHHSLTSHSGYIYVAGGFGKHRIMLNSVARFNVADGEWEKMPSLPSAIHAAAMCVINNYIYCVKSTIHYLSPGASQWTTIQQPLPYEMGVQCALPVKDKIYLLGAHVKHLLEFDTVTNVYTDIGAFQHAMGQGCVFRDRIYVFCGEDAENVEIYDLVTKQFKVVSKLQHCMYNHSVVVVPRYPRFK